MLLLDEINDLQSYRSTRQSRSSVRMVRTPDPGLNIASMLDPPTPLGADEIPPAVRVLKPMASEHTEYA